ncbi:MAG: D-2-hydroxyacid dehydrogenase [Deltaproteobacteria bacterium]|nr:D-2-hydroxyacid dehydrogenase [Deltaproteobacteria bacterium]
MRIVLLDGFSTDQGDESWPELRALGDLVVHPRTRPAQVLERCAGAQAVLTNKVAISAETMAALPGLRYIGLTSTGTNVVDLAAARDRHIAVTNVPAYSTESVAELVFAMILHFCFRAAEHDAAVKAGRWAQSPDFCFFLAPLRELDGKTLVVVGRGAIGQAVGRIGAAFGMHVVAAAVPGSSSAERVPLFEALPLGDVVTLHCPLTPSTRGMVNREFLAALRDDAILINTSRGPVVDEAALREALAAGKLGGVGLDVLEREPPVASHPLLEPDAPWASRLLVTPHLGWGTREARARLAFEVAANLAAFQAGGRRNRVE